MSNKFASKSIEELESMKKALEPVVTALPQYAKELTAIETAIKARQNGAPVVSKAINPCKKADLAATIAAQPKQEKSASRSIVF